MECSLQQCLSSRESQPGSFLLDVRLALEATISSTFAFLTPFRFFIITVQCRCRNRRCQTQRRGFGEPASTFFFDRDASRFEPLISTCFLSPDGSHLYRLPHRSLPRSKMGNPSYLLVLLSRDAPLVSPALRNWVSWTIPLTSSSNSS